MYKKINEKEFQELMSNVYPPEASSEIFALLEEEDNGDTEFNFQKIVKRFEYFEDSHELRRFWNTTTEDLQEGGTPCIPAGRKGIIVDCGK